MSETKDDLAFLDLRAPDGRPVLRVRPEFISAYGQIGDFVIIYFTKGGVFRSRKLRTYDVTTALLPFTCRANEASTCVRDKRVRLGISPNHVYVNPKDVLSYEPHKDGVSVSLYSGENFLVLGTNVEEVASILGNGLPNMKNLSAVSREPLP